jgi:hypothetical protein
METKAGENPAKLAAIRSASPAVRALCSNMWRSLL